MNNYYNIATLNDIFKYIIDTDNYIIYINVDNALQMYKLAQKIYNTIPTLRNKMVMNMKSYDVCGDDIINNFIGKCISEKKSHNLCIISDEINTYDVDIINKSELLEKINDSEKKIYVIDVNDELIKKSTNTDVNMMLFNFL